MLFNIYYFFVRRDVGVAFYVNKFFHKNKDLILLSPEYRDLVDQYHVLNNGLRGRQSIVFLGDSQIKRFNVYEFFPNSPVINRGLDSDTTVGILERLDRNLQNLIIQKLFLLVGYNDLQYRDNDEILANIRLIVKRIQAKKIYIHSLLPVDAAKTEINSRIVHFNEGLKKLCSDMDIAYIDLHKHFLDEKGGLSRKYSLDGAHLNGAGYQVWKELLEPKF